MPNEINKNIKDEANDIMDDISGALYDLQAKQATIPEVEKWIRGYIEDMIREMIGNSDIPELGGKAQNAHVLFSNGFNHKRFKIINVAKTYGIEV